MSDDVKIAVLMSKATGQFQEHPRFKHNSIKLLCSSERSSHKLLQTNQIFVKDPDAMKLTRLDMKRARTVKKKGKNKETFSFRLVAKKGKQKTKSKFKNRTNKETHTKAIPH